MYNYKETKPTSNMRVNTKLLKHILVVTDWVMNNDSPSMIKAYAKELKQRTDKYCSVNYNEVYNEIENINQTNLERFNND